MEKRKDLNIVHLRGMVMNIHSSPKVTLVTLSIRDYLVKRTRNNQIFCNFPTVVFYEKQGTEIAQLYKKYDHVTVSGIVQSMYDYTSKVGGEEVWGLSMETTPSILERASEGLVKGIMYPEDLNRVIMAGQVVSSIAFGQNWLKVSVKIEVDRYQTSSNVSIYSRNAREIAEILTKGKRVLLGGKIETQIRKKDEKTVRYQFINANEINILEWNQTAGDYVNTRQYIFPDEGFSPVRNIAPECPDATVPIENV